MPHVTLVPQHPAAVLDHTITVTGLADGETLTGTPVVTVQTGMTVGTSPAPAIAGAAIVFWLSGGVSGRRYEGEIQCDTSTANKRVVLTYDVTIYDRAPNA